MIGTATTSSVIPCITWWLMMNRCWSSTTHTRSPSSTGTPALPFEIHCCVRLEQGEDLLLVRNALTLQDASIHLIDLSRRVLHELVELSQEDLCQHEVLQLAPGIHRTVQVQLRLLQIRSMRLAHRLLLLLALGLILRGGVLELLRQAVQLLELAQVVGALAPVAQAVSLTQIGADLDRLADRVPQQIDVGRVVDVRLDYERVTPGFEACVLALFFYQHMTRIDHRLIDLLEQLGREQTK